LRDRLIPLTKRQRLMSGQRRRRLRLHERQVVDRVECQNLQRTFTAVRGAVNQPEALRLQGRLADDVIVREDVPAVADQKSRAHTGLTVLTLQQRAHLQQLAARVVVNALRRW
jgi:hypothetical protein